MIHARVFYTTPTTPKSALKDSIEAKVGRGHDPVKLSKALCEINELDSWVDNDGNVWTYILNPVDIYFNQEN